MLFGKKIRELRDENGVLQRQLAAKIRTTTTSRSPNLQIYKLLDTLCLLMSTDVY